MRALLLIVSLLTAGTTAAAQADDGSLSVDGIVVCRDVDRATRTPVEPVASLTTDEGPVACFTRVTGAVGETFVTHVWYHEGETRARVELPVRSSDWRTWSRKSLLPSWTGRWTVKVLDADGIVLATSAFLVTAPDGREEAVE